MTTLYTLNAIIKLQNTEMKAVHDTTIKHKNKNNEQKPVYSLQPKQPHICITNAGYHLIISVTTAMKNI